MIPSPDVFCTGRLIQRCLLVSVVYFHAKVRSEVLIAASVPECHALALAVASNILTSVRDDYRGLSGYRGTGRQLFGACKMLGSGPIVVRQPTATPLKSGQHVGNGMSRFMEASWLMS